MELTHNEHKFFMRSPDILKKLPLEKFDCSYNKYIIEKHLNINGNYITKTEDYYYLDFGKNTQNIANEYTLKLFKCYEIGGEFLYLIRKKMNFLIFMNKNEQKIKDMNSLLFYIYNMSQNSEDLISFTIIMCSYSYITDYKPNCLFHDKPYHFYTDYCAKNKEQFELFMKNKIPKIKNYHLNLCEVSNTKTFSNLGIRPIFLPMFIIYDQNFKLLYQDNLFQETPKNLNEICNEMFKFISNPYNPRHKISFMKKCPIRISNFFDKLERRIKNENCILKNEEEYNNIRKEILEKCLNQQVDNKRKGNCKMYFVKRITNLNPDLTLSENSKIIYLSPYICQNNINNPLPKFLFGNENIGFLKVFNKLENLYLRYTWKCALSFIENNQIDCELNFKTIKNISNLNNLERKEFNCEYHKGFELYYIPFNFKILFKDKTKFFSINLTPKILSNVGYSVIVKDINDKEKKFSINEGEITILQYFREDLYVNQFDLTEKIEKIKSLYPNIKFRYCILILIPCDKFKNSLYYDRIMNFINSCQSCDDILIFTYVTEEFKELTKIVTNGPFIYIFDQQRKMTCFEVFPGERNKTEEMLNEKIERILKPKWTFDLNKEQYKLIKKINRKVLEMNSKVDDKNIIELEIEKTKFFVNKESKYSLTLIKYDYDERLKEKLESLKNEIVSILGDEALKIDLIN